VPGESAGARWTIAAKRNAVRIFVVTASARSTEALLAAVNKAKAPIDRVHCRKLRGDGVFADRFGR
jgi:hypothetical protein